MGGMGSASLMLMFLAQRQDKGAWRGEEAGAVWGTGSGFQGEQSPCPLAPGTVGEGKVELSQVGAPFFPTALSSSWFRLVKRLLRGVVFLYLFLVCFLLLGMEPRGLCVPGNVLHHQATVSALMGI